MEERPPIRRVAENILCKRSRTGDKVLSSNLVVRFGTWNVRILYRSGSLTAAVRELARYKLYLVGVQEVRWDKGSCVSAGYYNFFIIEKFNNSDIWEQH